jgi:starch synthase
MRVLQLASEAVPFAKTGGLADVVGALGMRLASAGHDVDLVLPYHRTTRLAAVADERQPALRFSPTELGTVEEARLLSGPVLGGVRTWFVDAPGLFDRDGLYGSEGAEYPDNLLRFAAFNRAALLAVDRLEMDPDILHAHDWHAALGVVWAAERFPTVLTVHNLAYQGWFPAAARLAADAAVGAGPRLPGAGDLNLLREGLQSADQVTTVSPTYAREITRVEFGFGLDDVLRGLSAPVVGILNGLDTTVWDPEDDEYLPVGWNADQPAGKAAARAALLAEFDLAAPDDAPVFGLVSRLVDQKGIGLLAVLYDRIAAWTEARFVLVGTGDPRYERLLEALAELPHVASRIAFSERLAHLVEGGSDFFLMPSAFEPCGLNQMISQRYGTIPIVHRTGGLVDSVTPITPATVADGTASGIVFDVCDAAGLEWAIGEALRLYGDRATFERVRAGVMRLDHSWERRIPEYEAVYERARTRHAARGAPGTSPSTGA